MAKLMCISEKTHQKDINEVGDIVGSYPDDWTFTDKEKDLFAVVDIVDEKADVDSKAPKTKQLTKAKTTEWTEEKSDRKEVWVDENNVEYDIVISPKYKTRYEKGVKENYSRHPENLNIHSLGK